MLERSLLSYLVLGACAYEPGTFHYDGRAFPGVYVTVNCLDISVEHQAERVVRYAFGNRCGKPVVVDLAAARVYGRATNSDEQVALRALDPWHEIRGLRLDSYAVGHEAIEYESDRAIDRMCVDAASIAGATYSRWICFDDPH